jgi:hypothetical protein
LQVMLIDIPNGRQRRTDPAFRRQEWPRRSWTTRSEKCKGAEPYQSLAGVPVSPSQGA